METAREVIGRSVTLLLDANQKWTGADAVRRVRAFERFDPSWIEEPVLAEDLPGNVLVRQKVSTPVALGESLYSRFQVADYIRAGAVDIVQVDLGRIGGFTEWVRVAHLAGAHGLTMAPHYMVELSVHAVCGIENAVIIENVEGTGLADLGVLEEPLDIRDGRVAASQRPGHGVVFDEAALAKYRVDGEFSVVPTRLT